MYDLWWPMMTCDDLCTCSLMQHAITCNPSKISVLNVKRTQKISEDTRRKIEGHKIEINIPVAFIWNSSCLWDVYESLTFFDHSNHRKHSNHQELGPQRLVDLWRLDNCTLSNVPWRCSRLRDVQYGTVQIVEINFEGWELDDTLQQRLGSRRDSDPNQTLQNIELQY